VPTRRRSAPAFTEFGLRVQRARLRRGLTQEQLAEAAALNRSALARIELGQGNPSLQTILKLAIGLETDAGRLIRGLEKTVGDPWTGFEDT
jgi:transcriptional regulator with XRE-family HTH domain